MPCCSCGALPPRLSPTPSLSVHEVTCKVRRGLLSHSFSWWVFSLGPPLPASSTIQDTIYCCCSQPAASCLRPRHFPPMSVSAANLGFPRIGLRRELKVSLEAYWSGKISQSDLLETGRTLRAVSWQKQRDAGIEVIPSNDFSFYDQMLDTAVMVGAIPELYQEVGACDSLDLYFAMARGRQTKGAVERACCGSSICSSAADVPAQEMTKWFDTNYHYIVPEVNAVQQFALRTKKPLDHFKEAKALGIATRPVLIGPVTFLRLAKSKDEGFDPMDLLPKLLPVYVQLLEELQEAGAEWVQMDEPVLVLDLPAKVQEAVKTTYSELSKVSGVKLMVATYFGGLGDNVETALSLPVAGLHVDLVRAPEQLDILLSRSRKELALSLGVIDGRNVWKCDLNGVLDAVEEKVKHSGRHIEIAPSCSLLHTPVDLSLETSLDPQVKSWLAFATQKLDEVVTLTTALQQGRKAVAAALESNGQAIADRRSSPLTCNPEVRARLAKIDGNMTRRATPYAERVKVQQEQLRLPVLPTTTIGSFPQTAEVRKARAAHDKGSLDTASYETFLREEMKRAVAWQEEIGIDVLVHGEFERNDMVQYFGEQLSGFTFSRAGWVQSYGSRCVRPPIIYGDVSRPQAMTVQWWQYAQSLTKKAMKGMLTGPVTILQWSFVRDDQPRCDTCRQIALAIRDEVCDLEAAGAKVIQIDEAALREGLPLRRSEWQRYLDWAVESFGISASGVRDGTQIHTHMCYSEFNDIISAIGAMDADVISIETARSKLELLQAFVEYKYPNEIGPGVYDIHSPRIPSVGEMVSLLEKATERLSVSQLWVNPDCGLKTRKWEDVKPALVNMVKAAELVRASLSSQQQQH